MVELFVLRARTAYGISVLAVFTRPKLRRAEIDKVGETQTSLEEEKEDV